MNGYAEGSERVADGSPRLRTTQEAARRSERFARSVLDGLSAHVAVLNDSDTIVAANDAWKAFAGPTGPTL